MILLLGVSGCAGLGDGSRAIPLGEPLGPAVHTTAEAAAEVRGDKDHPAGAGATAFPGGMATDRYLIGDDVQGEVALSDVIVASFAPMQGLAFGDVDGDGQIDGLFLDYAGFADNGSTCAGTTYLLPGPLTGDLGAENARASASTQTGEECGGDALYSPDLDGDGAPDLVVVQAGARSEELAVWPAAATGVLTDPAVLVSGLDIWQWHPVNGDVDGDGIDDLFLESANVGALRFDGPLTATRPAGTADATITGTIAPFRLGDVDGDGLPEIVGAEADGSVRVVPGTAPSGSLRDLAVASILPESATTMPWYLDLAVADLDGDGAAEILLGVDATASPGGVGGIWYYDGPFVGDRTYGEGDARWVAADGGPALSANVAVDGADRIWAWEAWSSTLSGAFWVFDLP